MTYSTCILKVSEPKVRLSFAFELNLRENMHARNCVCIYACQTRADPSACALDRIRARNSHKNQRSIHCGWVSQRL